MNAKTIRINDREMSISEAARTIGVKPNTLIYRLRRGWGVDRAISGKKVDFVQSRGNLLLPNIAKDRENGMTLIALGEKYGFDNGNMSRLCRKAGVIRNMKVNNARAQQVYELRKNGKSCHQIAKTLGISVSTAFYYIKKLGFKALPYKQKKAITEEDRIWKREQSRKWRKEHKDILKQRRIKRRKSDNVFSLKERIRAVTQFAFQRRRMQKPRKSEDLLGCTWQQLEKHIESKFTDGMGWSNMGKWHIDHIIPLSSAKTVEEISALAHYTNLQPLWARDNLLKGNKYEKKNDGNGSI